MKPIQAQPKTVAGPFPLLSFNVCHPSLPSQSPLPSYLSLPSHSVPLFPLVFPATVNHRRQPIDHIGRRFPFSVVTLVSRIPLTPSTATYSRPSPSLFFSPDSLIIHSRPAPWLLSVDSPSLLDRRIDNSYRHRRSTLSATNNSRSLNHGSFSVLSPAAGSLPLSTTTSVAVYHRHLQSLCLNPSTPTDRGN